ncbi:fluoride efflux transporter CrcB [Clostridium sp. 'White wine YQ']|uniref:fluoride efflux transporter CrcB n=1 Tax=Clostridium sp. 'White wine YQ' TaxID=3027474 RepID=UPI00236670F9|nr:fluoride efflux transporter CrcB [Clostridium sp. 'White wine YQ']MDD7796025.1 fluoride efflux transporter CrcB [Clostridium sp. 'White wine YQ']
MKKYVFIFIGGMLGAILRYLIKNIDITSFYSGVIPLNTLAINICGSFILALVLTTSIEVYDFNVNIRLGIATGFLGAFTTFSTICKESVNLIRQGHYYSSIFYLFSSVILGLISAYLGVLFTRKVISKLILKNNTLNEIDAEASIDEEV